MFSFGGMVMAACVGKGSWLLKGLPSNGLGDGTTGQASYLVHPSPCWELKEEETERK